MILKILAGLAVIFIILVVIVIIRINRSTNKLRKNPKVGDFIRYYVGADKHYGTIKKVFVNIVRVDCLPYQQVIVKDGKMEVEKLPDFSEKFKTVTRNYRNVSKSEIYCVIY